MPNAGSYFKTWSAAFVCVALACVSVAQNGQTSSTQSSTNRGLQGQGNTEFANSPFGQTVPPESNYSVLLIAPGDEVEVSVYGAPDLSVHSRVDADGKISVPLIGYLQVAGLTSGGAEGLIGHELRQNHIVNNTQVSVYVKE